MKKLLIILSGILLNLAVCAQHFSNLYDHPAPPGVVDGTPKSFLVTGYSTSNSPSDRPWPAILQEMLNLHAGNENTYFVFKHTVGGTPIAGWTNICRDGSHIRDAVSYYIDPATRIPEEMPDASIMLAQQSLQRAFGDCRDPKTGVEGPGDTARIKLGAHAIGLYANPFLEAGIEKVYMAMHIYKTGGFPLDLYGERWALARAISETKNLLPGPELFGITKKMHPEGFAEDGKHPGPAVATIMAVYWYLVLAGEFADMELAGKYARYAGVDLVQSAGKE